MKLRDKTGGVVTTTVTGIGGLIIAVVVILVITSTVLTSNLLDQKTATTTRHNQTMTAINATTSQSFGNNTLLGAVCTVTTVINATNGTKTVSSGNYTSNSAACTFAGVAGTEYENEIVNVTSSTLYTIREGNFNETAYDVSRNFTSGIGEISQKLPTILLITAVIFLFGALVLLVRNAGALGIGNQGSL